MNARSIKFEMAMEGPQVQEVVASIFHTVLFYRSSGKFTYNNEWDYSTGAVGYVDVDCEFLDFAYVCLDSEALSNIVNYQIANFSSQLRSSDASPPFGSISLEFYEKRGARWLFKQECVPWEIWTVCCQLIKPQNELDRQRRNESIVELLQDKILYITDIINRYEYVPFNPSRSKVNLLFDTNYGDIQPYHFRIHHNLPGTQKSASSSVGKLMRDIVSF